MITFYELGQLGRLGNQLFQYAALRSLGIERGYEVKIPNPQTRTWHGQQCLLSQFNIEAGYFSDNELRTISHSYTEPSHEVFDNNFFSGVVVVPIKICILKNFLHYVEPKIVTIFTRYCLMSIFN